MEIYIVAINIGMALMMVVIYLRYSRFRITSAKEVKALRQRLDKEVDERKEIENRLSKLSQGDSEKVQSLFAEINVLRKEKEGEIKLRLEAEKQIQLTLQRMEDIQKRMNDWRLVQDAMMKDSRDAIVKMGNELFKKVNDSYKNEIETNKNLLGRVSQNISEFFEKLSAIKVVAPQVKEVATHDAPAPKLVAVNVDDPAKKLISDLVETMKAGGHLVNKNYFLPTNFDEQKAKSFFCDIAFLKGEKLHIIDFKACHYFAQFDQLTAQNKIAAQNFLKEKLEKYLTYLSNPKYQDSILKVLQASKISFESVSIAPILRSKSDLQILKEIHFYDKFIAAQLGVMDFDGVNNLVI